MRDKAWYRLLSTSQSPYRAIFALTHPSLSILNARAGLYSLRFLFCPFKTVLPQLSLSGLMQLTPVGVWQYGDWWQVDAVPPLKIGSNNPPSEVLFVTLFRILGEMLTNGARLPAAIGVGRRLVRRGCCQHRIRRFRDIFFVTTRSFLTEVIVCQCILCRRPSVGV